MLRRYLCTLGTQPRTIFDRFVIVPGDQMNFDRKIIDIGNKGLPVWIEGAAAPIHAAESAGKGDRSPCARRREDPVAPQLRQARAAGFLLFGVDAPASFAVSC